MITDRAFHCRMTSYDELKFVKLHTPKHSTNSPSPLILPQRTSAECMVALQEVRAGLEENDFPSLNCPQS